MVLKTRVFGLSQVAHLYRELAGKRNINQRFIIGAMKALLGCKLDDLSYTDERVS